MCHEKGKGVDSISRQTYLPLNSTCASAAGANQSGGKETKRRRRRFPGNSARLLLGGKDAHI
jgi:hypothetical protein